MRNISWLEGEIRDEFIELYLTLLINVVERPTLKYIPEFYKSSSEETRVQFIEAISHRLRNMEEDKQSIWWNSWLKRFLENRKNNKPVEITESECKSLFMLLPRLDFVIDDAINILCKGRMPIAIDNLFWYEMNDEALIANHSQSISKLLIKLLSSISSVGYGEENIIRIVQSLHGIGEKEKRQLQEALLRHNISLSLR